MFSRSLLRTMFSGNRKLQVCGENSSRQATGLSDNSNVHIASATTHHPRLCSTSLAIFGVWGTGTSVVGWFIFPPALRL